MRVEAQDGITDIIIMRNFYFIEQNHILQFGGVANYRALANQRASAHECAVAHLSVLSHDHSLSEIGAGKYLRGIRYPYMLGYFRVLVLRKTLAQPDNEILNSSQRFPRIRKL